MQAKLSREKVSIPNRKTISLTSCLWNFQTPSSELPRVTRISWSASDLAPEHGRETHQEEVLHGGRHVPGTRGCFVAEYLSMLEDHSYLPVGSVSFQVGASPPFPLVQWLSLWGHLPISGNIFGCYSWGWGGWVLVAFNRYKSQGC